MTIDFFLLGIGMIFIHDLDAMRCKEWRVFPILSLLNDKTGMMLYVFGHIPLIYWILLEVTAKNEQFRFWFDVFLIVHLGYHLLILMHNKNEFKDLISWIIITGAAACGAIDLIL